MRAKVGVGLIVCPSIKCFRQGGCLSTACRQIPLKHEDENKVALRREIRDVLGHYRSAFRSTRSGH